MPLVKIKPGLSHGYRAADGSHAYHQAGAVFDASPAEMESFGDKFILVEAKLSVGDPVGRPESPVVVEINATPGARKLAKEQGVSLTLSDIIGTGRGGKIIKADVTAFLNNEAEASMAASLETFTKAAPYNGDGTSLNGYDVEVVLNGNAK